MAYYRDQDKRDLHGLQDGMLVLSREGPECPVCPEKPSNTIFVWLGVDAPGRLLLAAI
jgi:hypothetical protein